MRSKGALFATVMVGAAALTILPAAAARADTSTPLTQLTGFNQMVVDDAAGYVFLSEGAKGTNGIVVTDTSGTYVTTLDSGDDVEGLALSSDGTTLYAALGAKAAVGVINVSTLTQTQWALPSSVGSPYGLALQSGDLWVSWNQPGPGAGKAGIGDFALPASPSASSPSFQTPAAMGGWYSAPDIAADPSDTGILVAAQPGAIPVGGAAYTVASGSAALLAQAPQLDVNCFDQGVAVFPGGAKFLLCNNTYSTATLAQEPGAGPVSTYAAANAVSADGSLVALAGYGGTNSVINVYPAGSTTPVNEFSLSGDIPADGVAFSSDDSKVYAVTENNTASTYTLNIIDDPALTHTTLTLSGPSSPVTIGNSVTISGGLQSDETALAGAPITITRTETGSSAAPEVLTTTTGTDGSFTMTDTPTTAGTYTYTASYAGTATVAPSTSTFKVVVTLVSSALTLTAPSSSAAVGHAYTLTGALTVGGAYPAAGTPVTITRTAGGSTAKTFTVATGANGAFTLTDNPGATGTYIYTASYPGSGDIGPATAHFTVTVALAKSTLTLTARATVDPGTSYPVSGHLSLPTGALTGATIVITRTGAGTKAANYTLKTNASGAFTLTDKRTVQGTYTYTAAYAGSATITAAKEAVKVVVAWPKPVLTVRSSAARTFYNTRVTITAHLGASGTNRTLWLYAQTVGSTAMKLIAKGRVNAAGNLSVGYATTHNTIYTAEFAADSRYSATRATATVDVYANVTMSNGGYYATQKINGIGYRVYHHTGRLDTTVAVAPDKAGRCVYLEVEQYDPSTKQWDYNATFGCLKLNTSSKVSTYLTLADAAGAQYRMFAVYTPTATDRLNLAGASGFLYFKVVT